MPKKILLADDSITIQKVVELTFSDGDYEVIAVNNGARAIAKLSEMRPDIVLSDIIMPEKNGYEVCEFIKSHPEYRTIPVILLTGTFEPFDPDRADKAGCDAVVTKPFESQSLIHKVEELIEQSKSNAPTAPHAAMGAPLEKPAPAAPPPAPTPPPPAAAASAPPPPPPASFFSSPPPASDAFTHDSDIFGSPGATKPTTELPFASSNEPFGAPPAAEQFSGETRAFPKMNFDELPKPSSTSATTGKMPAQPAPQPPSSSPWDEPVPTSGETRGFPRMSFEDQQSPPPPPASSSSSTDDSPFGAPPPAEQFSGETRAFPKMNLDELKQAASTPAPPPPASSSSPWDEPSAFSGETRGFPKMNFEDLEKAADSPSSSSSSSASPWDVPAPPPAAPSWPAASSEPPPPAPAPEPQITEPDDVAWSPSASASSSPSASSGANGAELTEEQVDRIARRVVQLMSDQVVRNIAWEVIPDLAEMVVKERIRQLETES